MKKKMSEKYIDYKMSISELKHVLKTQIRSEHSSLMAEIIINHLELTELGLSQLIGAMCGHKQTTNFKVLDEVYVSFDNLASWKMERNVMLANKLLFQDNILCKIIEIDLRKKESINVEYQYIDNAFEIKSYIYWVPERNIIFKDDELIE